MTQHNDTIRIRHMLDHAEEAVALVAGKDKTELQRDRVLELALIRLVEIIGEVSGKVSSKTHWKVSGKNGASEILGLDRSILRAHMRKLGIRQP